MTGVVTERLATLEDAQAILADLSEISAQELDALGVTDRLAAVGALLGRGEARTFVEDDKPVYILGCVEKVALPPALSVWFVATQRFFDMKAATVFKARRALREMRERHPGFAVESCSWSKRPQARRWFELIGFKLLEDNGYRRFVLVDRQA